MYPYDSVFEIFEQIIQHILFLGTSPRKRMQFLAALESSKRELTEMPYFRSLKFITLEVLNFGVSSLHHLKILMVGMLYMVPQIDLQGRIVP